MSPTARREVLTVKEVAELLDLSRNGVYLGAKRGEIPNVTVGRRVLFPRRAIEQWLAVRGTESKRVPDVGSPLR